MYTSYTYGTYKFISYIGDPIATLDKHTHKNTLDKHTHKNKDRVTRAPLSTDGELMCFGTVSSSCTFSGTQTGPYLKQPSFNCKGC